MRVVSLVPSVTETLVSWGTPPVACTRFCEQRAIETVGGTKNPDVPGIVALAPDLVVLDEEENRVEDHDALVAAGLDVHVLAVRDLADVVPQLSGLGRLVGAPPSWSEEGGFATASAPPGVNRRTAPGATELRALVVIWRRPWMGLGPGTYGSSLLGALGIGNVLGAEAVRYPEVSLEEVTRRGPDLVVAPSEPYPFASRHVPELEQVAPVVLVDGKDLFWWGARTPAALERLAAALPGPARTDGSGSPTMAPGASGAPNGGR